MKKFLIVCISGVAVGSIFAYTLFSRVNNSFSEGGYTEDVYAFQVGVYSVYNNALNASKKYNNSYIYQDENKYRVFLAIYKDQELVKDMRKYYEDKNVEVYLKKLDVKEDFLKELSSYEKILKKTSNNETLINANKNILGAFEKSLWVI